jgi:hypothetical protein
MGVVETLATTVKYGTVFFITYWLIVLSYRLTLHPLAKYPGPFAAKLTEGYGGFHALKGHLHLRTMKNVQEYGSVFRQGPNRLVFSSAKALHGTSDIGIFLISQ